MESPRPVIPGAQHRRRRLRQSRLRQATWLGTLSIALIGVLVGSHVTERALTSSGEAKARQAAAAVAEAAETVVTNRLEAQQSTVLAWAQQPDLSGAVVAAGGPGSAAAKVAAARSMRHLVLASGGALAAFVTDANGIAIESWPPNPQVPGRNFSDRPWYRSVSAIHRPTVSSAYRSVQPGQPWVIAVAAPVLRQGRLIGVVGMAVPVSSFEQQLSSVARAMSYRLAVVDSTGQVLAAATADTAPADTESAEPGSQPARLPLDVAGSAISGAGAVLRGEAAALDNRAGASWPDAVAASRLVPASGWSLVGSRALDDALASTRGQVELLRTMTGLLVLVITGGALLWRVTRGRRQRRDSQLLERFRAVYAASPSPIIELTLDLRVQHCNRALSRLLGQDRDNLLGHQLTKLLHPLGPALLPGELLQLQEGTRADLAFDTHLVHADGTAVPVTLQWAALADEEGVATAFTCIVIDQTETTRIHSELDSARRRAEALFDRTPIGLIEGDVDGIVTRVNDAFCEMVGYTADELVGQPAIRVAAPGSSEAAAEGMQRLLRGEVYTAERIYLAKDGREVPVLVSTIALKDRSGKIERVAGYTLDMTDSVTTRRALERALQDVEAARLELVEQQEQLLEAQRLGRLGSWSMDVTTGAWDLSEQLCRIWGRSRPVTREELLEQVAPDDAVMMSERLAHAMAEGGRAESTFRIRHFVSGDEVVIRSSLEVVLDEQGEPAKVTGTHQDVTEIVQAEHQAAEARDHFAAILAASPDFIYVLDIQTGAVVYAPAGRDIVGVTSERLLALGTRAAADVVHPEDLAKLAGTNTAAANLEDGQILQVRVRLRAPDGQWRWASRRITPFRRDPGTGEVTQVLAITRDVTDVVEAELQLQHAALHDPLTGLPNRTLLTDRLNEALIRSHATNTDVQLLFIDLDGFKRVNDVAGHLAGDQVLIQASSRIGSVLRPQDTLARVGGDEFVVIVEPLPRTKLTPDDRQNDSGAVTETAEHLAERVMEVMRTPFVVEGVEHVVTASIGITTTGPSRGHQTGADALSEADAAMYRAKRGGKNRIEAYDDRDRVDVLERARTEQALRQAVDLALHEAALAPRDGLPHLRPTEDAGARLLVLFQPVVHAGTGALTGFEALARIVCPDHGTAAPERFVPVAEDTGLIHGLGLVVLDRALSQLSAWRRSTPGLERCSVAVNVSALQARHVDFADTVVERLAAHDLTPADLTLELTETALLEAGNSGLTALRSLHARGIGIAIDDFGTGYASLRYLATLPVTAVKVDRSFTAGIPDDPTAVKIVKSVISLAGDLGLSCIVEGVETLEQRSNLPPHVHLQGFLVGQPRAAEEVPVLDLLVGPQG